MNGDGAYQKMPENARNNIDEADHMGFPVLPNEALNDNEQRTPGINPSIYYGEPVG
jgi:hypothetical protein